MRYRPPRSSSFAGEIAFDQRRVGEAARLLVGAARRFEPLDAELARVTHLEALGAAIWAGGSLLEAAEAAAPRRPAPARRTRSTSCSTPSRPR